MRFVFIAVLALALVVAAALVAARSPAENFEQSTLFKTYYMHKERLLDVLIENSDVVKAMVLGTGGCNDKPFCQPQIVPKAIILLPEIQPTAFALLSFCLENQQGILNLPIPTSEKDLPSLYNKKTLMASNILFKTTNMIKSPSVSVLQVSSSIVNFCLDETHRNFYDACHNDPPKCAKKLGYTTG